MQNFYRRQPVDPFGLICFIRGGDLLSICLRHTGCQYVNFDAEVDLWIVSTFFLGQLACLAFSNLKFAVTVQVVIMYLSGSLFLAFKVGPPFVSIF